MNILMTEKTQVFYWHALHWMIAASDWKIISDFEKALVSAVGEQFRDTTIRMPFSLETSTSEKIGKLHINREQISMAMTKNIIDVLTIISRNEIVRKGIAYFLGILLNFSAHWLDSSKLGILSTAMKPIFMHKIGLIIAWKGIIAP